MSYNSKYTGEQVEGFLDQIANGEIGGGGGITTETDPVFSASPAASITEAKKTEWDGKQDKITDLNTLRQEAEEGATIYRMVQDGELVTPERMVGTIEDSIAQFENDIVEPIAIAVEGKADSSSLATVATSGSYNDLSNKPTIPSAVTESTVSGWGFTKNTGTYSKPSGGIPKTDLASAVQTSLGKADTALQSYTEQYKGTVTGVKINGSTKSPSNGVVDLGTVITKHQEISISGDNNSGRPYLFIDTESVDGGLAIGVDATIDIADATEYGELADAYAVQKYVDEYVNAKQDQLVSGTNIKTINGQSLLGSGNITIEGGGGSSSGSKEVIYWYVSSGDTITGMRPNVVYWVLDLLNITIESFEEATPEVESYDLFTAILALGVGNSEISLTLPDYVLWANGTIPELDSGTTYELSISRISDGYGWYNYFAVLTPFKSV